MTLASPWSYHLPKPLGSTSEPMNLWGTFLIQSIVIKLANLWKEQIRMRLRMRGSDFLMRQWRSSKECHMAEHCDTFLIEKISPSEVQTASNLKQFNLITMSWLHDCAKSICIQRKASDFEFWSLPMRAICNVMLSHGAGQWQWTNNASVHCCWMIMVGWPTSITSILQLIIFLTCNGFNRKDPITGQGASEWIHEKRKHKRTQVSISVSYPYPTFSLVLSPAIEDVTAHIWNSSTWEAEAEGFLQVQD